jgi:hypothetical protein
LSITWVAWIVPFVAAAADRLESWRDTVGGRPSWLGASFFAAAFVGFAIQWMFSYLASRQSRKLNVRTETNLHRIATLVEGVHRELAEVTATSIRLRDNMVEFTDAALKRDTHRAPLSTHGEWMGSFEAAGVQNKGEDDRPQKADISDVIYKLVSASPSGAAVYELYRTVGAEATLEQLLYNLYKLRDKGKVAWGGSLIGWDTRVHVTSG